MASEESSSSSSPSSSEADSYIGSLISLTSKSEIRYQGILISIKPQESTIALHNVRSYGTEGRKKDGPQIPPSEKVYEYILFRGSDIKDLQVKSSPSLPTKTLQHSDPAIIQSQYTYAPVTHASSASLGDGTLAGPSSHATHPALARTTIPDAYSLYQTGSHLGSWVPSPVPTSVTGTSLATPMYVQSYVGDSSGQVHTPLQSVSFQSQPMINQVQYPEIHAPTSIMSLPEVTSSTGIPSQFAVPGPSGSSMPLSSNISLLPQSSSLLLSHLSTVSSHESSNQELNMMNLASSKPSQTSFLPVSSLPFSPSSISGSTSGALTTLPLLTPDPLAVPTVTSSLQRLYPEPREIGNLLPSSADLPSSFSMVPQEPLLPLPLASQQNLQELQGVTQFNEEFDFMTMNEKFNKDEVWGSLGKAKERVTTGDETEDPLHENLKVQEGNVHDSRIGSKPVYNKDDFFDTLSCNSLNRGGWTGRTKFSERMKLDTETFGEFQQRPPMGRGNHEPAYGGNFGSSYNQGRGYGYYGARGRGGYRPIWNQFH